MTIDSNSKDDDLEEDVERVGHRGSTVLDGMHNALHSNPDLRQAYKEAVAEGADEEYEAYEVAYRQVFGDEYWKREMADRLANELGEEGDKTDRSALPLDKDVQADDREEDTRPDEGHNITLTDWGDEDLDN